jgi:hypothetical protein
LNWNGGDDSRRSQIGSARALIDHAVDPHDLPSRNCAKIKYKFPAEPKFGISLNIVSGSMLMVFRDGCQSDRRCVRQINERLIKPFVLAINNPNLCAVLIRARLELLCAQQA